MLLMNKLTNLLKNIKADFWKATLFDSCNQFILVGKARLLLLDMFMLSLIAKMGT